MNKKTESPQLAFAENQEVIQPNNTQATSEKASEERLQEVWAKCLAYLSSVLSEQDVENWIRPIKPVELHEGVSLVIHAPSEYHFEILEERFSREFNLMKQSYVGAQAELFIDVPTPEEQVNSSSPTPQPSGLSLDQRDRYHSLLKDSFRFDTFYESQSNRKARKLAESVALRPGQAPSHLLFIYGHSGVGKTHLVQAIGARIHELYPDYRVCYVSSGLFETQYKHDSRTTDRSVFISYYQQVDVLIIDDIQGLIGKPGTQKAFFEIFNHLYLLNKQIILTSDVSPASMEGMEHRLITRMQSSVMVELERPDIELRRKIIHSRAQAANLYIPEEVVEYIAEHLTQNVREVEGVMNTLIIHAQFDNSPITIAQARKLISASTALEEPELTFDEILDKVCAVFEIETSRLLSSSRSPSVTLPRQVVMYICKMRTSLSYGAIAIHLKLKNHTSILHGVRAIPKKMAKDENLRELVGQIEAML